MSETMQNGDSGGLVSQRDRELSFTPSDSRIFNTERLSKEIKYNLTPVRQRIRSRSVSQSSTDSYSS
ncbi:unnamed protein product, partial [Candidula unifasciata]